MQRHVRRAIAAIATPLQASDTGAPRRSRPDGTSAAPLLNVPARGLAAACVCGPARRLAAIAGVSHARAVHGDAGRSCRAGVVPRAPVPGFFVQDSGDPAHTRRRRLRTPGHNTNE